MFLQKVSSFVDILFSTIILEQTLMTGALTPLFRLLDCTIFTLCCFCCNHHSVLWFSFKCITNVISLMTTVHTSIFRQVLLKSLCMNTTLNCIQRLFMQCVPMTSKYTDNPWEILLLYLVVCVFKHVLQTDFFYPQTENRPAIVMSVFLSEPVLQYGPSGIGETSQE